MAKKETIIYLCENASCGLRFPGFEVAPRGKRCPLCRSKLQIVSVVQTHTSENNQPYSNRKLPIEVFLDNIRSAFNVGSIFRTADGVGINKIYCCGITPTPDHPGVEKTSLGANLTVQWECLRNGVSVARNLKAGGCHLWALENTPFSDDLFKVVLPSDNKPIILIVGNEISGIDPEILELCERTIAIPMVGNKRSYNVAIAFSMVSIFLLYRYIQGFST
jgi:tRNA G18 (ribose-2'-O)-methylase SpoU